MISSSAASTHASDRFSTELSYPAFSASLEGRDILGEFCLRKERNFKGLKFKISQFVKFFYLILT